MAGLIWLEDMESNNTAISPQIVSQIFTRLVPFAVVLAAFFMILLALKIPMPEILISQVAETDLNLANSSSSMQEKTSLPQVINDHKADLSFGVTGTSSISPIFTPEVRFWESSILEWSNRWGVDPNLVATVMQIESCGDPTAESSAGASGLFQVMPFHFEQGEDRFDPQTNALRGVEYLYKSFKSHNGDLRLTFAGYNAGITGSKRPVSAWANETLRYVRWATGIYQDAHTGEISSDRLNEWLKAGGQSLCKSARMQLGIGE